MRQLIIGDIHGCYDELRDLLDLAGLGEDDEIISVGDLLDRGPDPAGVLDFFQSEPNARAILGNHELKHLRWLREEGQPSLSQRIARVQLGEARWASDCAWMATLPRYIELDDAIIAHGFYEPGLPLDQQSHNVLTGTMSGDKHLRRAHDRPWYELYDGDKPLVVGHLIYRDDHKPLVWEDRVFCIDTGCCHGGRLTALLLPEFRLLSVPARADHWTNVRSQHRDVALESLKLTDLTWERAEHLLTLLRRRSDEASLEAAGAIAELLKAARTALHDILVRIEAEHTIAWALLPPGAAGTEEEGRAYAGLVGSSLLAGLLHRYRTRGLDVDALQAHFQHPAAAVAFASQLRPLSHDVVA